MNPKVSVVMPVYNGGRYFAAALGSVIAQDYDNIEIIVVDDGSTDGDTAEVARAFSDAHPGKVRYLRQDNQGVAAALNTGIAAATGDFFAWLSHDDLYTAEFVSSQVRFFQSLGLADACLHANYSLIDAEGHVFARSVLDIDLYRRNPELGLLHSGINGCTVLIPMGLLRRYLPFDTALRYTQDYDLWGRILRDHPFVLNDADLVHYRMHEAQGTRESAATDEGNRLWIRLLEGQDELRRAQIFGSRTNFYAQMAGFLARTPYRDAADYSRQMAAVSTTATRVSIAMWVGEDLADAQQTYASILGQTHQNWELWLLAPQWTEITEALNNTIVDRSRITWIVAGVSDAELGNRALDRSRGDYLGFVRSGEWWAPNRLSQQVTAMQSAGAAISHSACFITLAGLSTRRIVHRPDLAGGRAGSGSVPPVEVALPTIMVHRLAVANGLRFEAGTENPFVLFVARLGLLYDWQYLDAPLAEIVAGVDSPLLNPAVRLALEGDLCRWVSASDRVFAGTALEPDADRAHRTSAALWSALNAGLSDMTAESSSPASGEGKADAVGAPIVRTDPHVLLVTHGWGGGTDRFVRHQVRSFTALGSGVLILPGVGPDGAARLQRVNAYGGTRETLALNLSHPCQEVAARLRTLGVEKVVINALVAIPTEWWMALKRALDVAGIPYEVQLHDYSYVCPRLHLTLPDGRYCGAPDLPSCERCIAVHGGLVPSAGVGRWRTQHGWLLSGARRVVAPHDDVRSRYQRYFPGLPILVEPHADEPQRPLRVVVMGHCGVHKGANTFFEVALQAERQRYPLEFTMIGSCDRAADLAALGNVRVIGAYPEGALPSLLQEVQPDIAWFPGQAAETFSYTLSAAFDMGLFPVAFAVGAIAERVRAAGTGLVLPLGMADDAEALCQRLLQVGIGLHGEGAGIAQMQPALTGGHGPAGCSQPGQGIQLLADV